MMEEPKKEWKSSIPIRRRSSLFGKTFTWKDRTTEQKEITNEEYQKRMTAELKEWDNLLRNKSEQLGRMEKAQPVADETFLTEESRNYIQTGVDLLGQYAAKLDETKRRLNFYLEERVLLMESKNDLLFILNQISDEESLNLIKDVLED